MRSKNSKVFTAAEERHVQAVKLLPCSVCNRPGPSDLAALNVTLSRLQLQEAAR